MLSSSLGIRGGFVYSSYNLTYRINSFLSSVNGGNKGCLCSFYYSTFKKYNK